MFSITIMSGFLGQFRPLEQIFHRNGPLAGPEILAERDNVDQVSCVWKETGMAQWLEHLPPASVPGFDCRTRRQMWVELTTGLLLVLVLAPRGFSPASPVFPSPQKPTFLNSNSIWTLQLLD